MTQQKCQSTHKEGRGQIEEGKIHTRAKPSPEKKQEAKNEDLMTPPCHKRLKKQATGCVEGSDQPTSHNKRMNGRQALDSYRSGARIRLKYHPLVPSHYRHGGPWVRGKRGYGLVMGRRVKSILGFLLKALLREMSC